MTIPLCNGSHLKITPPPPPTDCCGQLSVVLEFVALLLPTRHVFTCLQYRVRGRSLDPSSCPGSFSLPGPTHREMREPAGGGPIRFFPGRETKRSQNTGKAIDCLVSPRAFDCVAVPPGRPSITLREQDIGATFLTIRWSAPAGDGGRPVTGYRVVLKFQESGRVVKNVTVGLVLHTDVGGLARSTRYRVEVSAVNVAGAGPAGKEDVTTKYEGIRVGLSAGDGCCMVGYSTPLDISLDPICAMINWLRSLSELLNKPFV